MDRFAKAALMLVVLLLLGAAAVVRSGQGDGPSAGRSGPATDHPMAVTWDPTDVRISDPDTLFPGDQKRLFEPHLGIDPTDPSRLVAFAIDHSTQNYDPNIWSVDRRYRSTDGGATWMDEGPTVPVTWDGGDPVVVFAPDGTVFFAELAKYVHPEERVGGILVHRSPDGGATWDEPVIAVSRAETDGKCPSPDKEWLGRDATSGRLYLAWTDFVFDCEALVDDPLGIGGLLSYYSADIRLVTSDDEGKTWSAPVLVHDGYALGAMPTIGPDGTIHMPYWGTSVVTAGCPTIVGSAAAVTFADVKLLSSIFVATSRDGGVTWTEHETPTCTHELHAFTHPGAFSGGAQMPSIAVEPITGAAHVVYPFFSVLENRFTLMHLTSDDAGATWSRPVDITPGPDNAVMPAVHAGADGVLRMAYYVTRDADDTGDIAYRESNDGGATWSPPTLLTTQPMDLSSDAELGHYMDIDVAGGRVAVIWTDARNGDWNATEIWVRTGTLS